MSATSERWHAHRERQSEGLKEAERLLAESKVTCSACDERATTVYYAKGTYFPVCETCKCSLAFDRSVRFACTQDAHSVSVGPGYQ